MLQQNRRSFMKTLAAAATVTVAGTKSSGRVLGANETINVGIAGLHGRGSAHVGGYINQPNVRITHLIDPDSRTFASKVKTISDAGQMPRTFADVRQALEDRNLHAISIATPNHWHSLMTIWAAQAGKHVYVEKPMSHNVQEGRIAVETARKHNVIVQHGTQSRSEDKWAEIADVIKSGKLGKLKIARALCYKNRRSIGNRQVGDAPKELDFNLWLGPAQRTGYHDNLVHYNWHWFWDFGNGDIGNQGVHQMDIARWGIPNATWPRSVVSLGGRFGYTDQGETPNTQIALMDFGETQLIFEVRGLPCPAYMGQGIGNIFHLEEGTIAGNKFYPRGSTQEAPLPSVERTSRRSGSHFANFIAAIRSGRRQDLAADVLEGHYSSALGHLANISYRLGENVAFSPRPRLISDDKDALETVERMEEHLGKSGVKIAELTCRVGKKLNFDARTETFVDSAEANRLLTRQYRAPFVVPEKV